MIRFRVKELLLEKSASEGRRITLEELSSNSGIHRVTLSRMVNKSGYNTTTDILDSLCAYFECEVGDLAQYVRTKPNKDD